MNWDGIDIDKYRSETDRVAGLPRLSLTSEVDRAAVKRDAEALELAPAQRRHRVSTTYPNTRISASGGSANRRSSSAGRRERARPWLR